MVMGPRRFSFSTKAQREIKNQKLKIKNANLGYSSRPVGGTQPIVIPWVEGRLDKMVKSICTLNFYC